MKKIKASSVMAGIVILMLLLNIGARLYRPAADFYVAHIFPVLSGFWSKVTGWIPFSLGEWLIVIGVALLILALPCYGLLMLLFRKDARPKAARIYGQFYGWVLTWVISVTTLHFTLLYQSTPLSETLGEVTYDNTQVLGVIRQLARQANALSGQVARDEDGYFRMTDDLMSGAKQCMTKLAETYPQFSGSYPDAKPISHAYFFSQQRLLGIYYPHTMEANYNPVVYPVNLPVTICHEYTHLKGNIFEDEAGYYAFLACMESESADFRYSALISALEWLSPEFGEDEAAWMEYYAIMDTFSDGVKKDLYTFVPPEYWETHQEEEVIPTQLVRNTADVVMDTSLKVNGVSEGKNSYYGMTALLLHHYLQ